MRIYSLIIIGVFTACLCVTSKAASSVEKCVRKSVVVSVPLVSFTKSMNEEYVKHISKVITVGDEHRVGDSKDISSAFSKHYVEHIKSVITIGDELGVMPKTSKKCVVSLNDNEILSCD